MWIFSIISGLVADFLITSNYITRTTSRKLFNTFGLLCPALGLIWLSFAGCNSAMAVAALCVAVGLNGAVYSGFQARCVTT
jgi:hypothetical protein